MTIRGPGASVDAVIGTFTHHGQDRDARPWSELHEPEVPGCRALKSVSTPRRERQWQLQRDAAHYRHRLLGRCVAYKGESVRNGELHVLNGEPGGLARESGEGKIGCHRLAHWVLPIENGNFQGVRSVE